MPIYKYQCKNCGFVFQKLQKITDDFPESNCCDFVSLRRIVGAPNFSLAGGGWFKDGYDKKDKTVSSASE